MALLMKILTSSHNRSTQHRSQRLHREALRRREDPELYVVKEKLRKHPDPSYSSMSEEEVTREATRLTDPDLLKEFFRELTHQPMNSLMEEVASESGHLLLRDGEDSASKQATWEAVRQKHLDRVGQLTLKLHLSQLDDTPPSYLERLGAAMLKIPYGVMHASLEIGDSGNPNATYIVEFNGSSLVQPRRKSLVEPTALEATVALGGAKLRTDVVSWPQPVTAGEVRMRKKKQELRTGLTPVDKYLSQDFTPLRPRSAHVQRRQKESWRRRPSGRDGVAGVCRGEAGHSSSSNNTFMDSGSNSDTPSSVGVRGRGSGSGSNSGSMSVRGSNSDTSSNADVCDSGSVSAPTTESSSNSYASGSNMTRGNALPLRHEEVAAPLDEEGERDSNTGLVATPRERKEDTSAAVTRVEHAEGASRKSPPAHHLREDSHTVAGGGGMAKTRRSNPESANRADRPGGQQLERLQPNSWLRRTAPLPQPSTATATSQAVATPQPPSPLLSSGEDLTQYVQMSLSKILLIEKLVRIIVKYNKHHYYHNITLNCQTFVTEVLQAFGVWENFRLGEKLQVYLANLNKGKKEVYKSHKGLNDRMKYLMASGEVEEMTYDEARYLRSLYTIFHLEEFTDSARPINAVCSDPDCMLGILEENLKKKRPEGATRLLPPENYI